MNKETQNDLSTIAKYVEELRENPKNISKIESLECTVMRLKRHVKSLYSGYYVANYEYGSSYDYSTVVYEPLGYMTYEEAYDDFYKSISIREEELLDYGVMEVSKEKYNDFVYLRYLTRAYNSLHELERYDKKSYTNNDIADKISELRGKLDVPMYVIIV